MWIGIWGAFGKILPLYGEPLKAAIAVGQVRGTMA